MIIGLTHNGLLFSAWKSKDETNTKLTFSSSHGDQSNSLVVFVSELPISDESPRVNLVVVLHEMLPESDIGWPISDDRSKDLIVILQHGYQLPLFANPPPAANIPIGISTNNGIWTAALKNWHLGITFSNLEYGPSFLCTNIRCSDVMNDSDS